MRTLPRFGLLTAALLTAGGCQGTINNGMTGSTTGSGGSSTTGSGGSSTGTGGSNTTGTGGSATGTGGATSDCTALPPLTRRLWRLSVEQWGAAVQTLLSLPTERVRTSRGGEAGFAFFSDVSLQVDNDMQFDMYNKAEAVLATIDSTVTTTQ